MEIIEINNNLYYTKPVYDIDLGKGIKVYNHDTNEFLGEIFGIDDNYDIKDYIEVYLISNIFKNLNYN